MNYKRRQLFRRRTAWNRKSWCSRLEVGSGANNSSGVKNRLLWKSKRIYPDGIWVNGPWNMELESTTWIQLQWTETVGAGVRVAPLIVMMIRVCFTVASGYHYVMLYNHFGSLNFAFCLMIHLSLKIFQDVLALALQTTQFFKKLLLKLIENR